MGGQSPELYEAALPILLFQDEDKKKSSGDTVLKELQEERLKR